MIKIEFHEVIEVIDIEAWMNQFLEALNENFKDRVWFVGLQGSYGRGEATETSDIDVVVILDELSASDIGVYNAMLDTLPHRELICGFLSGKDELLSWDAADLFQFYYDTVPIKGSLAELLSVIDDAAVSRAIKIGAGNLYHGCVHNMLCEKSEDILRGLYKSAVCTVRAVCFLQSGKFIKKKSELIKSVNPKEAQILINAEKIQNGTAVDFKQASEALFVWAKGLLLSSE